MSNISMRVSCLALAMLMSLAAASLSEAAILEVPGDYATIQEAVDAAAVSGDRIEVSSVPFAEDVSVVDKDLQIVAVANPIVVGSFSWTNPSGALAPAGGLVEGFQVTGDVTAVELRLSFAATDLIVDGLIDISTDVVSDEILLDVTRCTSQQGISVVAEGFDEDGGIQITISECETSANISARGRYGTVTDCVVPNGSVDVLSTWSAEASDNVVTGGGIHLFADAITVARRNVVNGGGIRVDFATSFEGEQNMCFDSPVGINYQGFKGSSTIDGNLIVRCDVGINSGDSGLSVVEARSNTIVDCRLHGFISMAEFSSIEQNIVVGCGIGMEIGNPSTTLACNDVWDNDFNWVGVPDQTGMNGNISLDPLFCDPRTDDYTLATLSSCLPGNHPDGAPCGTIGAFGEGCSGPVPTIDTSWGRVKTRFGE